MAGNSLIFKDAEVARDAILESQKKEIAALYEKWADEICERAIYFAHKSTPSSVIAEQQMKELQQMMKATGQQVSNEVYNKTKANLYTVSEAVVASNKEWLKSLGFADDMLDMAFNYVPDEIVRNLVTGQIYDSGWSLSQRIWSDNEDTMKTAYEIVAGGVAQNKGIYEIAKDLQQYVSPSAVKPWNLKSADGRKIYPKDVDYNAQRLARTLVQHGYQQSFVATTQKNPFITDYIWNSNGSRVCDLCMERDGKHFAKDDLPLDHPNGMCTMVPNVVDNLVDQLADWFNGEEGDYPAIDEYAKLLGYKNNTPTLSGFIDKYGTSTKSPGAWFNSLTPQMKQEATVLKEASGLTWNKWYEKNVYVGDGSNLTKKKKQALTDKFVRDEWLKSLNDNDLRKMDKWTDDWVQLITSEERYGVEVYTGSAYRDMNMYLRGVSGSTNYLDEIGYAKSALMKAELPRDTVVRRGTDFQAVKSLLGEQQGSQIVPNKDKFIGAIIEDKGFMSTSPATRGGFTGDIELIIKVPKGTDAMYVDSISRHQGEKELLINAGTKFVVEDMEINSYQEIKKLYLRVVKK